MRMTKLAFLNFKNSFKSYLSLIISMSFAILVFYNFQNIIYSDMFAVLGGHNKEYIDMIVQIICLVLGCFLFFYIWYATNVFLRKRKKEIGIYIFMGLSNQKIGKMYVLEAAFIGIAAFLTGIGFGVVAQGLFQMVLLAVSGIGIDITFRVTYQPVAITALVFFVLYGIFMLKGYWNIVKSSVLDMVSAARQNEYVKQNGLFLLVKTVFGICVAGSGYYYAIKDGGLEVMGNLLMAVILVTAGTYLLFGGLLPFVFQKMTENKKFLYSRQRLLWVNQVVFRIKKNYRTYAIVCIMLLSAVSALAAGFAMKNRYENMVRFDNTYTFQLLGSRTDLGKEAEGLIESAADIAYGSDISVICIEDEEKVIASYSGVERLAEQAGMEFSFKEPGGGEVIQVDRLILMSMFTKPVTSREINGKEYRQVGETTIPYFGYMQNRIKLFIVNDEEYERLKEAGKELYMYNFKIADDSDFYAARDALDSLAQNAQEITGRVAVDPNEEDIEWIKVLSALCVFMFLVFIIAGGCIMFMRLYNDAFEEKERYRVMLNIGVGKKELKKSFGRELGTAYVLPFAVMTVSAYFSVHALEKLMGETLFLAYLTSIFVVFLIFAVCYAFSVLVCTRTLVDY